MKAIILAAGAAQRLRPLTDHTPKCLIALGPQTILGQQLDGIKLVGIKDVIMVVGYLKEQIVSFTRRYYPDLNFTFIDNPDYATTNTIYSLWLTKEYMLSDDFIYFNADVVFHPEICRLLATVPGTCLAVDHKWCGKEEVKVILDGDRIVAIGKELDLTRTAGEFIGVGRFARESNGIFFAKLDQAVQRGEEKAFFELAVNEMLPEVDVREADISHLPCIEIDFFEDLEKARNEIYPLCLEGVLVK